MKNEIGVITRLHADKPCFAHVAEFGLKCCQLCSWDPTIWTDELALRVKAESEATGVRATSFWAGWSGPRVWDFVQGPTTLGLVPAEFRAMRVAEQKKGADFAHALGLPAIITHLGFIPENAADPEFEAVVRAVREVAEHCATLGLEYWFETGQETPVTMRRLIEQVGTGNLGLNLDPANLILYGRANPVDALDVFGEYVRNIHAKDGLYPTDPMKLGKEVKVGTGRVRFPDFVRRLAEVGFTGEFIIEREISGDQQKKDIAETVEYLKTLLASVEG